MNHEPNSWCWCRPRVENRETRMVIRHWHVDPPEGLAGNRIVGGGREYEDSGSGAVGGWQQEWNSYA